MPAGASVETELDLELSDHFQNIIYIYIYIYIYMLISSSLSEIIAGVVILINYKKWTVATCFETIDLTQ